MMTTEMSPERADALAFLESIIVPEVEEMLVHLPNGGVVSSGTRVGRTLIKKGRQVHLFEKFDGFAVAVESLESGTIDDIEVHYAGTVYRTTVEKLLLWGQLINNEENSQYEPQRVMARAEWEVL